MGVTMTEVYEFECCMGLLCNSRHIWYRSTLRSVNSIVELTYRCRPFLILGSIELNLVKYNRKWFTTPHVLVVQIKGTCRNTTLFLVCFGWITKEIRYKGNCLPNCCNLFCWMYSMINWWRIVWYRSWRSLLNLYSMTAVHSHCTDQTPLLIYLILSSVR
jgi:hypothetical protein